MSVYRLGGFPVRNKKFVNLPQPTPDSCSGEWKECRDACEIQ